MRLLPFERKGIRQVLQSYLDTWGGELYLYGSRVDDNQKGGDIELLIIMPSDQVRQATDVKTKLVDRIQEKIGKQRIDITFASEKDFAKDPFLAAANEEKVLL